MDEATYQTTEAANKGITLVKDTQNLLPISTQKNKRICMYYLTSLNGGLFKNDGKTSEIIKQKFEQRGYELEIRPADTKSQSIEGV